MDAQETDGVLQVGDIPVVVRRDSPSATDHSQAWRSGAEKAYKDVLTYLDLAEESCPPYTDTRPYAELRAFCNDKIRAVMANGPAA